VNVNHWSTSPSTSPSIPRAGLRAHSRVHPAFLWGTVFLTATLIGRFALAWTDGWRAVGAWLIR